MLRTWASQTRPAINFSCAQQRRHRRLLAGFEHQDALVHVPLSVLGQPALPGADLVEPDGAALAIVGEDHVEAARIASERDGNDAGREQARRQQQERAGPDQPGIEHRLHPQLVRAALERGLVGKIDRAQTGIADETAQQEAPSGLDDLDVEATWRDYRLDLAAAEVLQVALHAAVELHGMKA